LLWHSKQTEIKTIIADESEVKKAKKRKDALEASLAQKQKDLKIAEYEVNTQHDKIKLNESRLYGGKINSPKELEDLQMEAAAFKKRLSSLEDTQLECMMQYEETDAEFNQAVASFDALLVSTKNNNEILQSEHTDLQKKIDELFLERTVASEKISAEYLAKYEKIRNKKKGLAVIEFLESTCPACGAALTSSQAQLARSPSKIAQCETCDRIFYSR
jgi:predicted  nucleic acid-binding Zn-ribbon protein